MNRILTIGLAAFLTVLPSVSSAQTNLNGIDFRYAPRWWQTAP